MAVARVMMRGDSEAESEEDAPPRGSGRRVSFDEGYSGGDPGSNPSEDGLGQSYLGGDRK